MEGLQVVNPVNEKNQPTDKIQLENINKKKNVTPLKNKKVKLSTTKAIYGSTESLPIYQTEHKLTRPSSKRKRKQSILKTLDQDA